MLRLWFTGVTAYVGKNKRIHTVVGNMEKSGRKPRIVPGDVLEIFEAREDRAEPLTASEIADDLSCARKTAYNKLQTLKEDGTLTSKKVGGRSRVYWVPIREHIRDPRDCDTAEDFSSLGDESDPLGDVEFPAGRDQSDCEAAVYAARNYLRDNGPASMREIVAEVMPAHSLGYDVPEIDNGELVADRYRGAWWRKVVKPGLQALPDVDAPAGGGKWHSTGEF